MTIPGREAGGTSVTHIANAHRTTIARPTKLPTFLLYSTVPVAQSAAVSLNLGTTIEEQNRINGELNQYVIEKSWTIWGPLAPQYHANWPWLKGFNGEFMLGNGQYSVFARVWIDQDLKQAMGH